MSLFNDESRHPLLPNADQIAMRSLNYTIHEADRPIEETMEVYGDDDGREITDDEIKSESYDVARHALAMCLVTHPHYGESLEMGTIPITTTTFVALLDALNITDDYLRDVEKRFSDELLNNKGYWNGR
jgi:hypothetical protein